MPLRRRPPTDDAALDRHRRNRARHHARECGESARARGTLIHHAPARAIGPLMVAMIETPFRTLLVAAARRPHGGAPRLGLARGRAVDVSAIARGANGKEPGTRPARAHPKDGFHEAAAQSARPRRSTATSCRMTATDSACRSVESVTRAWRLLLQVLTHRSAAHTLSQHRASGPLHTPPPQVGHHASHLDPRIDQA